MSVSTYHEKRILKLRRLRSNQDGGDRDLRRCTNPCLLQTEKLYRVLRHNLTKLNKHADKCLK